MKNKILFILICVLTVISCRKDDISDGIINQPSTPLVVYQTDLIGIVVDEDGQSLSGVQISSGQNFVESDINGLFRIDGLEVDGTLGAYVKADAEGYFSGGTRIYTQGTNGRQVQITLIERELSGNVIATEGETVTLQNGLSIDFPANGFVLDGEDYKGLVSIYAYHLDPSKEGYLDMSPGDLSGTDEFNNNYILESFGMIAVDMETADGQKVELKEGTLATIKVPVDVSLLDDAPSELPLWHFDEVLHKWVKEGTAELVNGSYEGQVSHFSWWNCDDFLNAANLCIQLLDDRFNGSMQGIIVELYTDSQGTATSTTDTEGMVNGIVPANEIIEVTIYNICGEVVYSGTIGPFTGNDNKEIIPVFLGNVDLFNFTGTIYDCEAMEFLINSIVLIYVNDNSYYAVTDESGVYNYSAITCVDNQEYEITAFNSDEAVSGTAQGTATTSGANVLDINLCNETQFLIVNGELKGDDQVVARRKPNETLILTGLESTSFIIGFYGFTVGTFPAYLNGSGTNGLFNSTNCTVTISQFDNVGGVIKGTVQGIDDLSGVDLEGSFVALVEE